MTTLGVISDTHGLLRPEACRALEGVDLIIHAGDVCSQEVLSNLRLVAPVQAVAGNMDRGSQSPKLPRTQVVETSGGLFYVLHDLMQLDLDPRAAGFAAVITGHTHRPAIRWEDGVLYFNPGSAGPRRSGLPVTVGKIELLEQGLSPEVIELLSP